jgi:hypothetical protein
MAQKCPICNKQKGKRSCPALDKIICPRCCFQERERGLNCPLTCPYFQKAKQTVRDKEIAANKTYYQHLMREFSRDPGPYESFFMRLAESVGDVESRDTFLEDVHVIDALYRIFEEYRNRIDGKEWDRETLLNRVGVVQTRIEEMILQYKIDNKEFTDNQVLIGLNYILRVAEIEKTENKGAKHFIEFLKNTFTESEPENRDGLIRIEGA